MPCGLHYMTTRAPDPEHVLIETVERRARNKRVQRLTKKRA